MSNGTCPCNANTNENKTFGGTLTGGVQEVAAVLPLLGTEQCEKHVGSALVGGWVYTTAAALSIFGSLGIVKTGISILFASISIYIPKFSMSFTRRPSFTTSWKLFCGAKGLDNAGFKPAGTVAPMISLEENRYQAEDKLVKLLEEKHIDNPESLSIEWRSLKWNIVLVSSSWFVIILGLLPYIPVIMRVVDFPNPWLYPILRVVGSVVAGVTSQFVLQHRILHLMRHRLVFTCMDRQVQEFRRTMSREVEHVEKNDKTRNPDILDVDDSELEIIVQDPDQFHTTHPVLQWDPSLPAEECLWSLENYLQTTPASQDDTCRRRDELRSKLSKQRAKHFRSPFLDRYLFLTSWTFLLLSLPAIVVGYVGCFTLVSSNSDESNTSLIWLGAEAALALLRILLWAVNPKFDECTDVTLKLELSDHPPLVTTDKSINLLRQDPPVKLSLIPEEQFLEHVTPYTGPLERLETPKNIALFFALAGQIDLIKEQEPQLEAAQRTHKVLYMAVLEVDKRGAFVLALLPGSDRISYYAASVDPDSSDEMVVKVGFELSANHPRRVNHSGLCEVLSRYYYALSYAMCRASEQGTTRQASTLRQIVTSLLQRFKRPPDQVPSSPCSQSIASHDGEFMPRLDTREKHRRTQSALDQTISSPQTASLRRKWNLQAIEPTKPESIGPNKLTIDDIKFLKLGDKYDLKSRLVGTWGEWNRVAARVMQHAWFDARYAAGTKESKGEQDEIDRQLLRLQVTRELTLVQFSLQLEDILHDQWKTVSKDENWFWWFTRQKRLENEKNMASQRMEVVQKELVNRAGQGERQHDSQLGTGRAWKDARILVDKMWTAAAPFDMDEVVNKMVEEDSHVTREVQSRFSRWYSELGAERDEMAATIQRIRNEESVAYQYPPPHPACWAKFGRMMIEDKAQQRLAAKLSSSTVFGVITCGPALIRDIINKPTTRSVINVHKHKIQNLKPNGHLLYVGKPNGEEISLPWVRENRERWWKQQTQNSFMFYFSPSRLDGMFVYRASGPIAHIMIFLEQRSCIRLRLLHARPTASLSVSIQRNQERLLDIPPQRIPEQLAWSDFDLGKFEPGRLELDLVVQTSFVEYRLRDIIAEFQTLYQEQ